MLAVVVAMAMLCPTEEGVHGGRAVWALTAA